MLLWTLHRALSTQDDLAVHYRRTVRAFFRAIGTVAVAVLLAVVTMIDGSLTSHARADESVKAFIRAGVVESYSCSPDAFVVVGPVWDTVRDDTQQGALDALSQVCSGVDLSVRRK